MDHELSKAASAQPPSDAGFSSLEHKPRLFVGGLKPETTESQLYNYFRKFGPILEVSICRNKRNSSKKFGYITFVSHCSVEQVCQEPIHVVGHKQLTVQLAFSHKELVDKHLRACGSKLYVFGSAVSNRPAPEIYKLLSRLGSVKKVVKLKSRGQYLNSCFVTFENEDITRSLIQQKSLVLPNLQTFSFRRFIPRLLRAGDIALDSGSKEDSSPESCEYYEYDEMVEAERAYPPNYPEISEIDPNTIGVIFRAEHRTNSVAQNFARQKKNHTMQGPSQVDPKYIRQACHIILTKTDESAGVFQSKHHTEDLWDSNIRMNWSKTLSHF